MMIFIINLMIHFKNKISKNLFIKVKKIISKIYKLIKKIILTFKMNFWTKYVINFNIMIVILRKIKFEIIKLD